MTTFCLTCRLKVTTAIVVATMLTACNSSSPGGNSQAPVAALPALPATLPLAVGTATVAAAAPAVTALPPAAPMRAVRVGSPADRYAYAESARSFSGAIGSAPPDYSFSYDQVRPWAWQGYDDSREFVEPVAGGYRHYYYRPGADTPYFVRDPDYGYGYDAGQLAVVYAPDGSVIPDDAYGARLDYAARYYARARALYAASRERHAVIAANWAARQASIDAGEQRWVAQQAEQRDWRAYHDQVAAQQQEHWVQEQARRRADTERYEAWHEQDFRTPPPPRAIPVAWAAAAWAGNARNYAPPAPGFDGDAATRQQAARIDQQRVASSVPHATPPAGLGAHVQLPPPRPALPPPAPVSAPTREQHTSARPQPAPPPTRSQPRTAPVAGLPPARAMPVIRPHADRGPPEAVPGTSPHQPALSNPRAAPDRRDLPRVPVEPREPVAAPRDVAPARPERPAPSAPRHAPTEERPSTTPPRQHAPERPGAPPPHASPPQAPPPHLLTAQSHVETAPPHVDPQPRHAPPARARPAPESRPERPQ